MTDTHVHVFDPERFGYAADRSYTPGAAPCASLLACHGPLGIARAVLVQPSVYGSDNACLLDALAALGPARCRGIAVVDIDHPVRPEALRALHDGGVRGLRLNLEVRGERDPLRARERLERLAALVDLPGWCVQVHCSRSLLPVVRDALGAFRVPLVLDHFGGLHADDAEGSSPALNTLLALLSSGRVYVKLSAFYRASDDAPRHARLAPLVQTLVRAAHERLLWGSDWPHTQGGSPHRDPRRIEPFRDVDLAASLRALAAWAGSDAVLDHILVKNPARLYGFDDIAP